VGSNDEVKLDILWRNWDFAPQWEKVFFFFCTTPTAVQIQTSLNKINQSMNSKIRFEGFVVRRQVTISTCDWRRDTDVTDRQGDEWDQWPLNDIWRPDMINGPQETKKPRLRSVVLALSLLFRTQVKNSWFNFHLYDHKLLTSFL